MLIKSSTIKVLPLSLETAGDFNPLFLDLYWSWFAATPPPCIYINQLFVLPSKKVNVACSPLEHKALGSFVSISWAFEKDVKNKRFNRKNIIVAYEPIWSIGTGKIPTADELKKTTIHIKKVLKGIFKKNSPAVLYGGSVDGSNVEMFKEIKEIDGFLIGGASKSSKKFIDIIKNYYR